MTYQEVAESAPPEALPGWAPESVPESESVSVEPVPVTRAVLDASLLDPDGVDPEGLARALQPFGRSRMLPAAAYTSESVLDWERRHLFAGTWTCLGRESDLRAPQRAVRVGDVAVLLTWEGERLRAFANTCRHRGHELMPDGEASDRAVVLCPYHAWSYRLDGSLKAAPGFHDVVAFDRVEHSLVELPVQRWGGWVFAHAATSLASGDFLPFADHLGAIDDVLGAYGLDTLILGDRHTYEIAANWKVIAENYHECYHCPLIHPELCQVSPPNSGDNYDLPGAWLGGSMDLRAGITTMSLTGESGSAPIPGVDPRRVEYIQLWPNLLVSAHPDYVMAHRLVPLLAGRTWVECSWYFVGPRGRVELDPSYAVDFWDLTNRQDWAACESVQRGLASPHFRPGPFSPSEDAVHQLVSMVGRGYRGQPLHT